MADRPATGGDESEPIPTPPSSRLPNDDRGLMMRFAVRVAMLVIIGGEVMISFFLLVSGLTAGAEEEDAEWYLFSCVLLGSGMLLMIGATWFSQRAALAIGLITVGCAVWGPDPFWGIGALLAVLLAGTIETGPDAPRWPPSAALVPATIVAFVGVLTCWILAALAFNPSYLIGAVVALAIPRWLPWSWVGVPVVALVGWRGYAEVTSKPPYVGIRDPILWYAVPTVLMLGGFLVVPWLVREVRAWSRAR